jgi:hypothetical protein
MDKRKEKKKMKITKKKKTKKTKMISNTDPKKNGVNSGARERYLIKYQPCYS